MNIGQILETHLGWAAAHGVFAENGAGPNGMSSKPIAADNPHPVATPVFDGATEEDVDEALVEWAQQNPDSPIKFVVDQKQARRPEVLRQGAALQRQDAASPSSRR